MSKDLTQVVNQEAQKTTLPQQAKKGMTVFDLVKSMESEIKKALPKHLTPERFTRILATVIRMNPKLAACTKESFLGAIMTAAQLGLEPNVLGQCYLIPYKNECQFIIGYQGLIQLARRSGQIADIYAEIIYEKDEYEIVYGLDRKIIHKPNFEADDRGKAKFVYAVATLKDGNKAFVVLPMSEVLKRKSTSSSAGSSYSPWNTWGDEMIKKTALKYLAKYLPLSTEQAAAINTDEVVKKEIAEDMTTTIDFEIQQEEVKDEQNNDNR